MRRLGNESGQAVVLVLLCMTCLLGFVAFAVDIGTLFRAKRVIQTAADAGAIAGAAESQYGDATAGARAATAQNGVTHGSGGTVVTVNNPPLNGPHTGIGGYVEVIATQSQPTVFMNMFSRSSMNVTARAVAALGASNGCVYTLGTSGTDILMNGSGNISIPGCAIIDDSSSNDALHMNGSGHISAQSIGIVGDYSQNGSGSITPTPVTGIAPVGDPLAFLSPPSYSGCTAKNINGSGSQTIGPSGNGTICYSMLKINGSGTVTLNPGTYVITGAFTINGSATVNGTGGVTFYFPSGGSFTNSGSSDVHLTAPTSGAYNGILFYQDRSNTSGVTINGSSSSVFTGIFYFPSAQLTLNGSNSTAFNTTIVTGSLRMNGSGSFTSYALLNAANPITSARLVE